MMGKFEGKVVIITGASGGIGTTTAVAFAKEGAKLALHGRNEEKLNKTAALCEKEGSEVLKIMGDLRQFGHLENIIKQTVEKFSSIDILINSAGYGQAPAPIRDMELEVYEKSFEINVRAPFFLCRYAFPYLKESKGCVVNISSIASMRVSQGFSAYSMTKTALDQFTRCFSAECALFGIRVNSINPGRVETDFGLGNYTKEEAQWMLDWMKKTHLFGIIQPEAVTDGILFLCSSPNITGTSLAMDSGCLHAK